MAIYLDYFMRSREEGILIIAIRDDDGTFTSYRKDNIDGAIGEFAGLEAVVVYERPLFNIIAAAEEQGIGHYIEDYGVRERWLDLSTFIRKETGKTPSLASVAKSTLGEGPQSRVMRLGEIVAVEDDPQILQKMEERTDILKRLYEYTAQNDQLSFEIRNETTWVEVAIVG